MDADGNSPLHLAAASANKGAVEWLCKHLKSPAMLMARNKAGLTPALCLFEDADANTADQARRKGQMQKSQKIKIAK